MVQERTVHWVIRRRERPSLDQNWSFWQNVDDVHLLPDGNHWYLYDDTDRPTQWYEYEVTNPKDGEVKTGIIKLTLIPDIHPSLAEATSTAIFAEIPWVFPEELILSHYYIDLFTVGETFQLTATVLPVNVTNKKVLWSIDNPDVATVSGNGLVTAVSSGTASITACTVEDGITAVCLVNVGIRNRRIDIHPKELVLDVGNMLLLKATVYPVDALDQRIEWSTSNYNIASLVRQENSILVKANHCGQVIITASTRDGISGTCEITVREPAIPKTEAEGNGIVPKMSPTSENVDSEIGIRSFAQGIKPIVTPEEE